ALSQERSAPRPASVMVTSRTRLLPLARLRSISPLLSRMAICLIMVCGLTPNMRDNPAEEYFPPCDSVVRMRNCVVVMPSGCSAVSRRRKVLYWTRFIRYSVRGTGLEAVVGAFFEGCRCFFAMSAIFSRTRQMQHAWLG